MPGNDGIISVTAHASAVQKTQWAPIRWSHSFTPSYSSMMCFANGRAGSVHVGGSAGGLGPARHAVAWGGANCAAYQRHSAGQHQLLPFVRTLCPRPAQPPPCSSAHGALRLSPSRPCAVQSGPRLLRRFTADQGTGTLAMACVTCKGLRCQAVAPFLQGGVVAANLSARAGHRGNSRGLQIEGGDESDSRVAERLRRAHWGLHGRSGAPSDISTAPFRAHCPRPQAHRPFRSALSPHSIRA